MLFCVNIVVDIVAFVVYFVKLTKSNGIKFYTKQVLLFPKNLFTILNLIQRIWSILLVLRRVASVLRQSKNMQFYGLTVSVFR